MTGLTLKKKQTVGPVLQRRVGREQSPSIKHALLSHFLLTVECCLKIFIVFIVTLVQNSIFLAWLFWKKLPPPF